MSPDFVAPGVNVRGIFPDGYGTMTGTSVSAAVTSGASALLLEWGIVDENIPTIDGNLVRTLLISGCYKDSSIQYPNIKWGYGKLDLIGTMNVIKESIQ
jgi:subtilisin family serine protease